MGYSAINSNNTGEGYMGIKRYYRGPLVDTDWYQESPAYRYFIKIILISLGFSLLGLLILISLLSLFLLIFLGIVIFDIIKYVLL